MVDLAGIRNSLESSLFSKYGKTVTLISKSSPTYNTRGEITGYTETESSITIVDYGITTASKQRLEWGVLETGDRTAAIPYGVDVNIDDEIQIRSTDTANYRVVDIRQPELPDRVVTLALLRKVTT